MPTDIWATLAATGAAVVAIFAAAVAYWQARVTSRQARRKERVEERAVAAAFLESAAVLLERLDQATRSGNGPGPQHLYDLRAQMVSTFSRVRGSLADPSLEESALRLYSSIEIFYQGWQHTEALKTLGVVDSNVVERLAHALSRLDKEDAIEFQLLPGTLTGVDRLSWVVERSSFGARMHCHAYQDGLGAPSLHDLQLPHRWLTLAPPHITDKLVEPADASVDGQMTNVDDQGRHSQ